VTTVTVAEPDPMGDTIVKLFEAVTVRFVAGADPKRTVVAPVKYFPVRVTVVPPDAGPVDGFRDLIVGSFGLGATVTLMVFALTVVEPITDKPNLIVNFFVDKLAGMLTTSDALPVVHGNVEGSPDIGWTDENTQIVALATSAARVTEPPPTGSVDGVAENETTEGAVGLAEAASPDHAPDSASRATATAGTRLR
jgi:hypothetical protein